MNRRPKISVEDVHVRPGESLTAYVHESADGLPVMEVELCVTSQGKAVLWTKKGRTLIQIRKIHL